MKTYTLQKSIRPLGALLLGAALLGGCAAGDAAGGGDIPPPQAFSPWSATTSQDIKGDGNGPAGEQPGDLGEPDPEIGANPDTSVFNIYFETPTRGEWLNSGQTIHAIGRVVGGKARSVTVGGQPVTTSSDGSFSVELVVTPGMNYLTASAVSEDGEEVTTRQGLLVGANDDPNREVENAVAIHMGPAALSGLGQMVADSMQALDLNSMLAGGGTGGIQVTRASYGNITADVFPGEGFLNIRIGINGVQLHIQGTVDILGNQTPISGVVRIGTLEINAPVNVRADGNGGIAADMNGGTANLRNFDYDLDNTPGFIEDIFEGMVEDMVRDGVQDALVGIELPPFLGPDDLSQTLDLMGTQVDLGLAIKDVEVRTAGLQLWLSGSARALSPRHDGYVMTAPSGRASLDPGTSLDLGLNEGFFSRLLYAAWAGGGLDFVMEPGDPDAGVELKIGLLKSALGDAADVLDPETPVTIQARSLYPPIVSTQGGEKPLVIEMSDMLLGFSANSRPLFTASIHLSMEIGLSAAEDGSLKPELEVEAFTEILESPIGRVDRARLATLIGAVARTMPEGLVGGIFEGGLTGSLPINLSGFQSAKMEPDPSADGWAHIKGY